MIVFLFMFSFFMRLIEINSALVKPYLSTLINIIITLKSIAAHFTGYNRDFNGLKCILARSRVRVIDCSGCFVVNFFSFFCGFYMRNTLHSDIDSDEVLFLGVNMFSVLLRVSLPPTYRLRIKWPRVKPRTHLCPPKNINSIGVSFWNEKFVRSRSI